MPPGFGSFIGNVRALALHTLHTRRYGLEVHQAAARVLDREQWCGATLDDLGELILAVLEADRAGKRVDWCAVFRAQLLLRLYLVRFADEATRRVAREELKSDGHRVYVSAMEWELSPERLRDGTFAETDETGRGSPVAGRDSGPG